ncbi:uncharacterized protein Z519_08012 [Cladophialophora bantiana CBS 173.52]|uniref:Uncharacterized protein n=1 Tax=Cladophialophora bantiana (strain ATCC 10958 / CBS 173.52 / CDC B-1940 / NIH 8579) TaxID=1442370 RepID=A0A0D2HCW4_CLAB1|nr:uncharacterized protein Z519_08012 [Cladophialophora bantiana CBS 173.52]KIW91118.1 hypothetical protein Z519_08012 [Cladophialophora bantiana CBS 173.52]
MPAFPFNGSLDAQSWNETRPQEDMDWECHFTGRWKRALPLLVFCVFMAFMVIVTGRHRRQTPFDGSSRINVGSLILYPEYTVRSLNETSPLLKAETWKQVRAASRIATPASLSDTPVW